MYRLKFYLILFFSFLTTFPSTAQNQKKIDSLLRILPGCKEDTVKVKVLYRLGWEMSYTSLNDGLKYAEASMKLALNLKDDRGLSYAYHDLGSIYIDMGDFNKAGEFLLKELELIESKRVNTSPGGCYIELGILYMNQNIYAKALHFDSLALSIYQKDRDEKAMAVCYINQGSVYQKMNDYQKAIEVNEKSLVLNLRTKRPESIATAYLNLGDLNMHLNKYDEALRNIVSGTEILRQNKLTYSMPAAYASLGDYYMGTKQYKTAILYWDSAQTLLDQNGMKEKQMEIFENLSEAYEALGDFKNAYANHKMFASLQDSLFNDTKSKEFTRNELKYEFGKKEQAEKSEQEKKDAVVRLIFIGLGLGVLALGVFLFFIYRANLQKKRINNQLEEVNALIQEKNKNITDSINYAKRIQRAILPSERTIRELLPTSFILLKPKDIVSGDFYWIEKAGKNDKVSGAPGPDKILLAAVDCTGHGVPGAMVSVVGHNNLNRCLKEFNLSKPSDILDKLNELVQETFEDSEDEVRDGMDIALCLLDKESGTLEYAGANNPLWIIRKNNGSDIQVVEEIKGDKQPIGKYTAHKPFTNHRIEMNKGDTAYIFSDGFADQFGGEKGKKFKYKSLQKLILSIQDKTLAEQEQILLSTFVSWQNVLEQVDDVLIVGIRM